MSEQADNPKPADVIYVDPPPGDDQLEPRDFIYALEVTAPAQRRCYTSIA
jgi:hypothetical protein